MRRMFVLVPFAAMLLVVILAHAQPAHVDADKGGKVQPWAWNVVELGSPSASLLVQVCYSPQGRCFPLAPQAVDTGYRYSLCSHVVYEPDDPALVEIAGSNGGLGVVTTITASVQNQTSATVRDNGLLHEGQA